MQKKIRNIIRHCRYGLHYLVEKIRGLDFTSPDMKESNKTGGVVHGYCKTDGRHIKKIFDLISIDESYSFLDIGCGKGAVLKEACKYSFDKVSGIEYSKEYSDIAINNFERLGLSSRVKVFQGDASLFNGYADYNVFYLFNPFDEDIMEKVISKIAGAHNSTSWIIYHHPTCPEVFTRYGCKEFKRLVDHATGYETIIYKLR